MQMINSCSALLSLNGRYIGRVPFPYNWTLQCNLMTQVPGAHSGHLLKSCCLPVCTEGDVSLNARLHWEPGLARITPVLRPMRLWNVLWKFLPTYSAEIGFSVVSETCVFFAEIQDVQNLCQSRETLLKALCLQTCLYIFLKNYHYLWTGPSQAVMTKPWKKNKWQMFDLRLLTA